MSSSILETGVAIFETVRLRFAKLGSAPDSVKRIHETVKFDPADWT